MQSEVIDWDAVRASLRRRIVGQLDPHEYSELEDLVQEGCVRLLRASRRDRIDDVEAMVTVIARRTFSDHLRRRYRNERVWRPLDDQVRDRVGTSGPDSRFGDMVDRVEFMVLQVFEGAGRTDCRDLARAWFECRSWKDLATQLGVTHATVRKRWSRCLELPRTHFATDPDLNELFEEG